MTLDWIELSGALELKADGSRGWRQQSRQRQKAAPSVVLDTQTRVRSLHSKFSLLSYHLRQTHYASLRKVRSGAAQAGRP